MLIQDLKKKCELICSLGSVVAVWPDQDQWGISERGCEREVDDCHLGGCREGQERVGIPIDPAAGGGHVEQVGSEGWQRPVDVRVVEDILPHHCCHLPGGGAAVAEERGSPG